MRRVYLKQLPRAEAGLLLMAQASLPRREEILPTGQALGRVTTKPIFAKRSIPTYHAAAMDGIVVRAASTYPASDQRPLTLFWGRDYEPVDTGDPIPDGFDAVIRLEDVQPLDEESLAILAPVAPWQYIRHVGEDIVAEEMLLPALRRLEPADLAALLAGGVTEVPILARPRVILIPTGDELVPPAAAIGPGQTPEFNSVAIAGYLSQWGASVEVQPILGDDLQLLVGALKAALAQADLVIVNAGSSAGRADYTSQAIEAVGRLLVHGIAAKPGKPTALGVAEGKPIIGLPGYPVSAFMALEWFARPLLHRYFGQLEPERPRIKALLGRRIASEMGSEEFVRLTVGFIGGRFVANPLNRGASLTMSMVRADGLLIIPANSLGMEQGTEAEIELYRDERQLRKSLVAVGSHDLALDLLASALKLIDEELSLSSAHAGSMGGITAIRNGLAHLAGVHLLDQASGEYNIPFIKQFLPNMPVVLVNLSYRMQGWIVGPGNPLGITEVAELAREGVRYVNRQRGAGTRLLLDYLLEQARLQPEMIHGYQREEYTHLNVAAAIAAGTADIGLGIFSAARAYELTFVPVAEERYDLLMARDFFLSDLGRCVLRLIVAADYQRSVEALGGYSLRDAGRVIYEQ